MDKEYIVFHKDDFTQQGLEMVWTALTAKFNLPYDVEFIETFVQYAPVGKG